MLLVGSLQRNASFVLWFIWCVGICASLTEIFAEEGKEGSLSCVGNTTKHLKNIWWTSKSTILSKCHPGNGRCSNYYAQQYTATKSETYRKYKTKLMIRHVRPDHRDQIFSCVDDGDASNSGQSFLLRVYSVPNAPECKAEEVLRGRIKVMCGTSKVYPGVNCEISPEFRAAVNDLDYDNSSTTTTVHTSKISYTTRSFKEGTTGYNSVSCSTTVDAFQAGLYRFQVKMYPSITNTLVASVDGYTNTVTIQLPVERSENGMHIKDNITVRSSGIKGKNELRAEALTDDQSSKNKEGQIINSDTGVQNEGSICENYKDAIINRQVIVIMFLTVLVACTFLMHIFPVIRDAVCRRNKIKDPARV